MTTPTTNYQWQMPVDGGDFDNWGVELNTALQAIDTTVFNNAAAATTAASNAQSAAEAASLATGNNLSDLGSLATALGNLGLTGSSGGASWGGSWSFKVPIEMGGAVVDVIVQGGQASGISADTTTNITFPVAFPTACWGVYPGTHVGAWSGSAATFAELVGTPSRTGCEFGAKNIAGDPVIDVVWWAVGY